MQTTDELNQQFSTATTTFEQGQGGISRCKVANKHANATLYMQGAHVESFQPKNETPVLWMSDHSRFETGKPIRGGIPICWPWFGPHLSEPDFPQHGFARVSQWEIRSVEENQDSTVVVLGFGNNTETEKIFPYAFDANYRVEIGKDLTVELSVTNLGIQSMQDVGCALHTYFSISDIERIRVSGLEGTTFLDKLTGNELSERDPIRFSSETDRVYFEPPELIKLLDGGNQREITIRSQGSRSTVVWNPWIDKSKRMEDFPDEGYKTMVCVETANAIKDVRQIEPGETHTISQKIEVNRV